jgi:hypothetical protein
MATESEVGGWKPNGRRGLPFWPSDGQAGKPMHPVNFGPPKACRRCGYSFLFWHKTDGNWRLHHYALLPGKDAPEYVLHRCGFKSDGTRRDSAARPASPILSPDLTHTEE